MKHANGAMDEYTDALAHEEVLPCPNCGRLVVAPLMRRVPGDYDTPGYDEPVYQRTWCDGCGCSIDAETWTVWP